MNNQREDPFHQLQAPAIMNKPATNRLTATDGAQVM